MESNALYMIVFGTMIDNSRFTVYYFTYIYFLGEMDWVEKHINITLILVTFISNEITPLDITKNGKGLFLIGLNGHFVCMFSVYLVGSSIYVFAILFCCTF